MLARLFPKQADNDYRGLRLGLWLLVPLLLIRGLQGFNSIWIARETAIGADGIPLDSYAPAAADTVVALFALLGLGLIVLASIGTVILLRYRALIPFAYLLLLVHSLGSRAIIMLHPILRAGAKMVGGISVGALVNYSLLALMVLGFVLSLIERRK